MSAMPLIRQESGVEQYLQEIQNVALRKLNKKLVSNHEDE
jgi:hypothetical protein